MIDPEPRSTTDPVARRRTRQLMEIVGLLHDIADGRAGALVAEHLREFPEDATEVHRAMQQVHQQLVDEPNPSQLD